MTDEGAHIHNAGLDKAEMWGLKHGLTFSGVSCGHGYRSREVTVFMDEPAIKKMIMILELGMAVPSCHERPITQVNEIEPDGVWEPWVTFKDCEGKLPISKPPCPRCLHWDPRRRFRAQGRCIVYDGVECCTKADAGFPDFSCYKRRGGTE